MRKRKSKAKVTTKRFRGQLPAALALEVLVESEQARQVIETEVARQIAGLEKRARKMFVEVLRTETHKEVRRAALDEVHALLQSEAHRVRLAIEAEAPRGGLYIPAGIERKFRLQDRG